MRVPRTVQPLPRYVRRKWLKGHTWAYFFEPPTWARKNGCPVAAEALGSDYPSARDKAESVLLPLFDSWRTGGLSDVVPQKTLPGTFDWLVKIFKEHRTWSEIDRKTQRMYEQGLNLVGDHILKDTTRVDSKLLLSFTRGFVDALYAKILVVEETDWQNNQAGAKEICQRGDDSMSARLVCRYPRPGKTGSHYEPILEHGS